jgi:hypothetical protein
VAKSKTVRANPALRLALVRRLHVYVSVFVTPSLIFFALTGALQTFRVPDRADAPVLLQKLARVHRDDVFAAKPARPKVQTAGPAATEAAKPAKPGPRTRVATEALKWFFALVSVAVAATSLLGLWMALAYNREKVMLLGVLAAGAAIPLLILAL